MADVKMLYIEDDIKKIQTKTNLYIQQYGPEGAFHLAREIIQNCIDELIDKDSVGSNIEITYDETKDKLTVKDDGRGFPEVDYPLDIFFTKIQSGSKFFRSQSGGTSGEYGLGATAVNALSDEFTVVNWRSKEDYRHEIRFKAGKKVYDKVTSNKVPAQKALHGSEVSFIPSKAYLGDNTHIPYDDLKHWIEVMSYLLPEGSKIKIKLYRYKGVELIDSNKYKKKDFNLLLNTLSDLKTASQSNFTASTTVKEKVRSLDSILNESKVKEEIIDKNVFIQFSLTYDPTLDTVYDSYCNFTATSEGGVHQTVVDNCFCRYMQNAVNKTLSDTQKEKLPVLWDDVRAGLRCVINLYTNAQVGFVGNAKQKIASEALVNPLKEVVYNAIDEFFNKNQSTLNEYIKIVKSNAKARLEMLKVKTATQKERMTNFKEHEMSNFIRCNNTGKNQFKEIFLAEGSSAAGSARNGCDPDTQAFFMFRGVTANPMKCSLADIMNNREWRDLVNVLRCGIGPTFDINKLYFNRINILTDADVDGYGISSGMLVFIYLYLRPLIEAGKVYKVYSPLYRLNDRSNEFIANKSEMVELWHRKITKNIKVKLSTEDNWMSKGELREFLTDTYDYTENLSRIANDLGRVNKFFVESILVACSCVFGKDLYREGFIDTAFTKQTNIKKFMNIIQDKYKETSTNEKGIIKGSIDGSFYTVKVNERLIRKSDDILKVYNKYGVQLDIQEKNSDKIRRMSICEFLDMCNKFVPSIHTRYKGLGELNGKDLKTTTLDMANRISVQYTVEDAEKEYKIFKKLHGNGKADLAARKEMMANYKINRFDLDN